MANTRTSKQMKMASQAYVLQLTLKALLDEVKEDISNKPFYFPIQIEAVEKEMQKMIDLCNGEHQKLKKVVEKRRKVIE